MNQINKIVREIVKSHNPLVERKVRGLSIQVQEWDPPKLAVSIGGETEILTISRDVAMALKAYGIPFGN